MVAAATEALDGGERVAAVAPAGFGVPDVIEVAIGFRIFSFSGEAEGPRGAGPSKVSMADVEATAEAAAEGEGKDEGTDFIASDVSSAS